MARSAEIAEEGTVMFRKLVYVCIYAEEVIEGM
jgi:hypothetical protein